MFNSLISFGAQEGFIAQVRIRCIEFWVDKGVLKRVDEGVGEGNIFGEDGHHRS